MNLQNGYKVVYEKAADGKRTFYATNNPKCDPNVDDKIVEATIGEYKLIYEKNGKIYGSTTGVPADSDRCFAEFDKIFKEAVEELAAPATETSATEEPTQTYTRRARKSAVVEEPVVVEENKEIKE
jgi:hypothetical protein